MNKRLEQLKIRTISAVYDRTLAKLSFSNCAANPLFIIGSGRNGSTLLAAILNNHQHIFVPGEHVIIPAVLKYAVTHPFASWQQLLDFSCRILEQPSQWELSASAIQSCLAKLPVEQQTAPYLLDCIYSCYGHIYHKEDVIWADKTPANTKFIQFIKTQFPKSKIVFLLRDPRDVVASYFAISRNSKPLDFICWRWQHSLHQYDSLKKKYPEDIRLLKYENLVTQPKLEVDQLIQWLGLSSAAKLLENHGQHLPLLGVDQIAHHLNAAQPINQQSIGRWEAQLSPEDVKKINRQLKNDMKRMSYV